jgi:hypothetical protein
LPQHTKRILTATTVVVLVLAATAKTSKLTGKLVAYDLVRHTSKSANLQQNEEIVIFDTNSSKHKDKYVKVMFSSSSTTQIDPKYFDGTQPLTTDVFRDRSCDEKAPRLVREITLEQMGGTYLLTDAYKAAPPGKIKTLECYVAIQRKKKK